ncbi:hypothetical protein CEXT_374221 [Caerostris extrusa]|uniref:Uncharacterized protein n=1 Tax=Caerostris extrusa TaxID=172846 RepID=A0AAV4Y491_CAEEX|nr:hypothetical protein CEXT_374221 [Caerostris extrusa]
MPVSRKGWRQGPKGSLNKQIDREGVAKKRSVPIGLRGGDEDRRGPRRALRYGGEKRKQSLLGMKRDVEDYWSSLTPRVAEKQRQCN